MEWLVEKLAKIKGLGIHVHMPQLGNGGGGLGRKDWKEHATILDQCAAKLKKKLHCDLRKEMKEQRAGRETRLSTIWPWCSQQRRVEKCCFPSQRQYYLV